MERTYRIAGLTVNMDVSSLAESHARPYEIEYSAQPDIVIDQSGAMQRFRSKYPKAPQHFCEYTGSGTDFYGKILDFGGMLLHSSTVLMDGKAYMFTADSGTGKSTHTSLYRRVFGDERARILNDDKPAVRCEDGKIYAYGTPWSGKSDLNLNLRAPIGGICVLRRGEVNRIERLPVRKALPLLLRQTHHADDPEKMEKIIALMNELLISTPVWVMECNMDPEAAKVSYEAMSGYWEGRE